MNSEQPHIDPDSNSQTEEHFGTVAATRFPRVVVWSLFPLLICASLSLGWWVPIFYAWSGDDQSKSPPIVRYVMLGFLVACLMAVVALPLLPQLSRIDPVRKPLILRLRFRMVVVILATVTACLLAFREVTTLIVGGTAILYPLSCAIKLGLNSPSLRWRIVSLYSCLYLPFVWIFTSDVFRNVVQQGNWLFLPLLAGAPALIASVSIGGLQNPLVPAGGVAIVGLEVILGLWFIQLGARRAVAYQIALLAVSVITSYGLLGLLRA